MNCRRNYTTTSPAHLLLRGANLLDQSCFVLEMLRRHIQNADHAEALEGVIAAQREIATGVFRISIVLNTQVADCALCQNLLHLHSSLCAEPALEPKVRH